MGIINNFLHFAADAEIIIVEIAILLCNLAGVVILMITVAKSIWNYFHRERHVKLSLAQGIALALEFKLAGEILRTITVRDWDELAILGTIIVLRGAISLLIHWEIKAERIVSEGEQEAQKKNQKP